MATSIGLRTRFIIAGAVLVMTTIVSSVWSALTFDHLSRFVGETLQDSEETTAATAALSSALEREDDALLFALSNAARGSPDLAAGRRAVAAAFHRLDALLILPEEREAASAVRRDVDAYHAAGDALLGAHGQDGRERYQEDVNPLLRVAVNEVGRIRDHHYQAARAVASYARDETRRATFIVSGISLAALLLSVLVAYHLGRVVVWPLRDLTRSVEAMRKGDFEQRVVARGSDEIGRLAEGFNRMAENLAEFRRSNVSEVLAAKKTLEATLRALPDAVVVFDPDGRVASLNPAANRVLSTPPDTVESLALPGAALSAVSDALQGKPAQAPTVDLAKAIKAPREGDERRLLPRVVAVPDLAAGRSGAVLILSDVTELVRLDEMRMELVAVASHELRTPLTTMRMTLTMLSETSKDLTPRQRELVATAFLGVDQLAATIDQFLDLTRIESGQLRLAWDRFDPMALLGTAANAARAMCEGSGVSLRLESDTSPPPAWGDAARVQIVLSNILTNAVKYTPAGGTITLRAAAIPGRRSTDRMLEVSVTDVGPGVPPEYRERIFDKFFRVEHHQPRSNEGVRGSGIGLYLSRQIIEAHAGTIRCEAGEGERGTRIVFTLPTMPPEERRASA
jgi:NtrC-family two-component system sensor histidine kinase KinB